MDEKRIFQTIEDNFRLMQLSSREQASETRALTQKFEQLADQSNRGIQVAEESKRIAEESKRIAEESKRIAEESKRIAEESKETALGAADLSMSLSIRAEHMANTIGEVLTALGGLGYSSADIRQELSELRSRVDRLEERAS